MHVQTISAIWLEEHLHEVGLQLILRDGLKLGNLLCLPIEVILMSSKLTVPHPAELLTQVLILLRNGRVNGTLDRSKLLISHVIHFLAHFVQMHI